MNSASHSTMPTTCRRHGAPARRMEPWYDQACRDACKARDAVERNLHSTGAQKEIAEKQYHSVTDRKKSVYMEKRNAELCAKSAKDPNHFWRAFKAPSHNSCPMGTKDTLKWSESGLIIQQLNRADSSRSAVFPKFSLVGH